MSYHNGVRLRSGLELHLEDEISEDTVKKAQLIICDQAESAEEAGELLSMLGLDGQADERLHPGGDYDDAA